MSAATRAKWFNVLVVWLAIYPSITAVLWWAGDLLSVLPLPLRTLVLTGLLVPWMVFVMIPFLNWARTQVQWLGRRAKWWGLFLLLSGSITSIEAQSIPVETFVSHTAVNLQLLLNRPLPGSERWTILTGFNINLAHDPEDAVSRYHIAQVNLGYRFGERWQVYGGVFTNKFRHGPSVGVLYRQPIPHRAIVLNHRQSYLGQYVAALLLVAHWRPPLGEKTKAYFRLQALVETNAKFVQRQFQQLRAGIDQGGFQFGPALTLDQFGPRPLHRTNAGLFLRIEL